MRETAILPDADSRSVAESTFDRNVVVIAGAGTGKTTLLVNRLIHVLMREPDPVTVTEVVGLTFTNKAATEMKLRLRQRLMALARPDRQDGVHGESGAVLASSLRTRYGLSTGRIAEKAEAALRDLEKAQIGTLHSFAAHLLRLHPIESGMDPSFREDEGLRFDEHFDQEWQLWLAGELGPHGANHIQWRQLIAALGLVNLRAMAYALCNELIPLHELRRQTSEGRPTPAVRQWMLAKRTRADELLATYCGEKPRKVESLLRAALPLFDLILEDGVNGVKKLPSEHRNTLEKDPGRAPSGWTEEDFAEAGSVIRAARRLLCVNHRIFDELLEILVPFAERVRMSFVEQGWISFDGLLARARTLLHEYPGVRERLKHEYKAVLVDEFQDTDPVQYEIILYLAEHAGRTSADWRQVELAPGKLFIVGDPKQSIYAFRRADIEAFDQVVNKIKAAGGTVLELVTNFRSHAHILKVVNASFDQLFRPKENIQPPNVPLEVCPGRAGEVTSPGVELRVVTAAADDDDFDVSAATRAEAEAVARWLKEDVLAKSVLTDTKGHTTALKPGHVALLFRKLTQAQDYLDALRRYDIPYITDGEKHFYRRQEIVDLINVLRTVENPHDTIALAGLLRSPLGGVPDRDLYELSERNALDYRRGDRLASWHSPHAQSVKRLYDHLLTLSGSVVAYPLAEAIDQIFARLPVLELAAASLHAEQAVANVLKVRQMAADLADRPHLSFSGFVDLMITRLSEQPEEAESALGEESLEAVRVLTIHKAKGLEFPVVVLPGFHHGSGSGHRDSLVSHDWSSGMLGMAVGEYCTLGSVLVSHKYQAREEAERRRLLYVGMTRAKERLVLSGGLPSRPSGGTFLGLLDEAACDAVADPEKDSIHIGSVALSKTVLTTTDRIARKRSITVRSMKRSREWKDLVQRWDEREHLWKLTCTIPLHLTPTRLARKDESTPASPKLPAGPVGLSLVIGTLAHRVLEEWDFNEDPRRLEQKIEAMCSTGIPDEWGERRQEIAAELQRIFGTFTGSDAYKELQRATVLGREIPFVMPWSTASIHHLALPPSPGFGRLRAIATSTARGPAESSAEELRPPQAEALGKAGTPHDCVMEGIIDIVYRLDDRVWVADYKTDQVSDEELPNRAATYSVQARVYAQAVSQCLGLENVGCKLVFLRSGRAVEV